jgi:hypothetical protein
MTVMVVAMVVALLVALVVIWVFSSHEWEDGAESRPREAPDEGQTHLGDLLGP